MKTFDILELARMSPDAYNALPEVYQSDSVLEFRKIDGTWLAFPKVSEEPFIGRWASMFHGGRWIEVEL